MLQALKRARKRHPKFYADVKRYAAQLPSLSSGTLSMRNVPGTKF